MLQCRACLGQIQEESLLNVVNGDVSMKYKKCKERVLVRWFSLASILIDDVERVNLADPFRLVLIDSPAIWNEP